MCVAPRVRCPVLRKRTCVHFVCVVRAYTLFSYYCFVCACVGAFSLARILPSTILHRNWRSFHCTIQTGRYLNVSDNRKHSLVPHLCLRLCFRIVTFQFFGRIDVNYFHKCSPPYERLLAFADCFFPHVGAEYVTVNDDTMVSISVCQLTLSCSPFFHRARRVSTPVFSHLLCLLSRSLRLAFRVA